MKRVFVYPKLDTQFDIGIRIGGAGLANCLFVFARAFVYSINHNIPLINPTWQRIGPGPYLRREKDKRHYFNLFKPIGIHGIKKYFIINYYNKVNEPADPNETYLNINGYNLIVFEGLKNYFEDIYGYNTLLKNFLDANINQKYKALVNNFNFKKTIGIHIRLGDFADSIRTPLSWYQEIINALTVRLGAEVRFLLFSDGSDIELKEILSINNVQRVYFGSAITDIIALSNCKAIIGSDSSFSGWGAYLGKVPSVFYKKHYSNIFNDGTCEQIIQSSRDLPDIFFNKYE